MPGVIDNAFNGAQEGSKDARGALQTAGLAERVVDLLELPYDVTVDELTIHPASGDY
jgi:NADP-dependent 3-hydroxy acid dehydrogenase YdfG